MSFTKLASTDFVVSSDSVTAPAWSSNNPTLSQFFTASAATTSGIGAGASYLNVYQAQVSNVSAAVQFAIAYGHNQGSGSIWYNPVVPGVTPSLVTYKQYKTLVYGPEISGSQGFNFGGAASNAPDIFVINLDRNRYKQSLFPGTFNLTITDPINFGSVTLTDNSNDTTTINYLDCGRVFDIVSGVNGKAVNANLPNQIAAGKTVSGSYGLFLPDIGTIILNASALALTVADGGIGLLLDRANYGTTTLPANANNINTNNVTLLNALNAGSGFQLNSQETVTANYAFIRIGNAEYNYTSNPTFISGSGNVLYDTLIYSPQTYITTVGMYNDNNELLAVAKLSKPLVKDFTKEALIRVKLDW